MGAMKLHNKILVPFGSLALGLVAVGSLPIALQAGGSCCSASLSSASVEKEPAPEVVKAAYTGQKDASCCGSCDEGACSTDVTMAASLQEELSARSEASAEKIPAAMKQTMADGQRQIDASGVLDRALNIGAKAPNFSLPSATGEAVSLSELLSKGPVVLTWYRGGWCPYCNIQLAHLQKVLPQFEEVGATLVAISPETPDNSLDTAERNALSFTVLSDTGNTVAKLYGVAFELPEKLHTLYEEKLELSRYNGDSSGVLPLAATYVIDTNGVITWAFLDTDYTKRAEPREVLSAVRQLSETSTRL